MVMDRAQPGRHTVPDPPVVPLLLAGIAVLALVGRPAFDVVVRSEPAVQAWATVFVAIVLQAVPFLVLGTLLSAVIATFVRPETVARVVPRRRLLAVPVAGLAGVMLPTCECTSVPIAGRMIATGFPGLGRADVSAVRTGDQPGRAGGHRGGGAPGRAARRRVAR
jgi:hypothetical protein